MRSLHYGNPGLATVFNVWWPRLHRGVVAIARTCTQGSKSGKKNKTLLKQKQVGKLPECKQNSQEAAVDFAGLIQNAVKTKNYLLVSEDHFSGWPEAKFSRNPTTERVIQLVKTYIGRYGFPQVIRIDSATIFRSKRFKDFCKKHLIRHIECPIRDYRGNVKIKRLIRYFYEKLTTNKRIVLKQDNSGLEEILFPI